MSLGITFHQPVTNIQSRVMELVKVMDAVIEVDRNLLPGHETEIPFFQKRLVLGIVHALEQRHNVPLQIHQRIDITVDFRL